jgi:hypothetical protein
LGLGEVLAVDGLHPAGHGLLPKTVGLVEVLAKFMGVLLA